MIGTFTIRSFLILASSKINIPQRVKELFSYIPAAVLPAFIFPSAFYHQGSVDFLMGKERFVVMIASGFWFLKTRSPLTTIIFGLLFLYGLNRFL